MTGVERHQYMDNNLSDIMRETYGREERIRDKFLSEAEHRARAEKAERIAAGLEVPRQPTPEEKLPTPEPRRQMTQKEMEVKLGVELSKNLWKKVIPGYQIGSHAVQSSFHSEYTYDPDEIDPLDKKHNRRRDMFTDYVEARARYNGMMGAKGQ